MSKRTCHTPFCYQLAINHKQSRDITDPGRVQNASKKRNLSTVIYNKIICSILKFRKEDLLVKSFTLGDY